MTKILKIGQPIVGTFFVDVMDHLISVQTTTESFFND